MVTLGAVASAVLVCGSLNAAGALDWAFPSAPHHAGGPAPTMPPPDQVVVLAGSSVRYHMADYESATAIDWYPNAHPRMPAIVVHGDMPKVIACGYCHLPNGAGRPENAVLASLPAEYIEAQVHDMRAGLRSGVQPGWLPTKLMIQLAHEVKPIDVAAAAAYFSKVAFVSRVRVLEASTIPAVTQQGYVYQRLPGSRREALGERIVEMPNDVDRFEKRDPTVGYTAYVPIGSIEAGSDLARKGSATGTVSCMVCHGQTLRGSTTAPPLAGHSPTGLFRQLAAFRARLRHAPADAPLLSEIAGLTTSQLIDLSAYAASLR